MDITKYILFGGDDRFANQFYVVVSPAVVGICLAGLLLLPWIGASQGGKKGLAWAVGSVLLLILGNNAHVRMKAYGEQSFATDVAEVVLRISIVQVVLLSVSALLAWIWLRRQGTI